MASKSHRTAVIVLALGSALLAALVHPADDTASLLDEARAMLERGDHAAAEREARARLVELEASIVHDSTEVAEALDLVVEAALRGKSVHTPDLVEFAGRAVEIKKASLGRRSPGFVDSLLRQARLLSDLSEFDLAEQKFREAIPLLEAIYGPDHERVADGAHDFARMLIRADEYAEARELLERVIAIRERAFGPGDISVAKPLTRLGWVLMEDGRQEQARVAFERAIGIAEDHGREGVPELANALSGYGNLLKRTGDYAGARAVFERAVAVTEADPVRQAFWLAASLANLGILLNGTGEYDEAGVHLGRALEIWESLLGPADRNVGSTLVQIGWMRMEQGDYVGARTSFERAVAITERSGPRGRLVSAVTGYGSLLRRTGDYREARAVFERAVSVVETPPIMKLWLGGSLLNLAALLGDTGELAEAERLCRRGLELSDEVAYRGLVRDGRKVLAGILSKSGRLDEARSVHEQVLMELEETHGPDNEEAAGTLMSLARIAHHDGELPRGRDLFERALRIRERTLGPDTPAVGASLAALADSLFDMGELTQALARTLRAEEIGSESLRLTARALSERQALAYALVRPEGLDLALTIIARGPSRFPDATAKAWDALIRSRAVVLDEMSARQRSIDETGEVARFAQDLSRLRSKLANLTLRGPGDLPTDHYRKILEETRADKERAERALAEKSAAFRRESELKRTGLADVAEALPPDTALVAYVRYGHRERHAARTTEEPRRGVEVDARPWRTTPRYLALVLPSGDASPVAVPLGLADHVETRITAWAEQAHARPASVGSAARSALEKYRSTGEALRRAIWDPVVPHLAGAAMALVVPDGPLHLVNLTALPTTTDRFLVETGPRVHLVSAERDVVRDAETVLRRDTLLAVGDPDFEARPTPPPPEFLALAQSRFELLADLEGAEVYRGQQPRCEETSTMRFGPLPASRIEVDSIVSLWTEAHSDSEPTSSSVTLKLTGPAAHETLFKSVAPHHAVLHLATHGFFVEGDCEAAFATAEAVDVAKAIGAPGPDRHRAVMIENPLLRAGLALAGANNRASAGTVVDDGILTAEEVASLDLSGVDWAVLSACRTGVGEIVTGEGVLGLRRAFEIAGANTLIMTLWAVDDESTRAWMRRLYSARLSGSSSAESVAQASRTIIEERRESGLSVHPFYWGAFVAAGDWR